MKKIFLALMAVAAIALVGCKKDSKNEPEQVPEAQVKMQAAKEALGTDGDAFLAKMREVGFVQEKGSEGSMYKKGDEFCYITINGGMVVRVAFYTKPQYANFDAAINYVAEYEAACAKVFPDNFAGSCILESMGAFFNDKEEPQFLNFLTHNLKANMFTSSEHVCTGESNIALSEGLLAERTLTLARDEEEWLCRVYIDLVNKD